MFELTDPVSEVGGACHQEVVFSFREFRLWGEWLHASRATMDKVAELNTSASLDV